VVDFVFNVAWQLTNRITRRGICLGSLTSAVCAAGVIACHDRTGSPEEPPPYGVVITPPSATLNLGDRLTFVASVFAGPGQSRQTTWATANASVATVNATTGEVTAVGTGTTNIIATSLADTTLRAVAPITVGFIGFGLSITSIKHEGVDVNLSNIVGQIDVGVALDFGTQTITKVDLLLTCAGVDTVVVVQPLAAATRALTLSFNTAAYKNGPCTLKVRATTSNGVIVASSAVPITLNNPSASATLLGAEYLRHARLQRVQILSQRLITLDRVMPDTLIHARSHAGEIRDLRL